MQIRYNCESAAFNRCGSVELIKTNKKLDELLSTQRRLILRQYLLQCKLISVYMVLRVYHIICLLLAVIMVMCS